MWCSHVHTVEVEEFYKRGHGISPRGKCRGLNSWQDWII